MQDVEVLFRNIRDIRREITILRKHEHELRESMLPSAIRYDKDSVSSSPQDPMSKYAEKISDTEEIIKKRLLKLQRDEYIAQKVLDDMPTSKYRTLLFLRYIDGGTNYQNSWAKVAQNVGYDEQYVRQKMHQKALSEAQIIYKKIKKIH